MVFELVLLMLLVNRVPFRVQASKAAKIKARAIIFLILNDEFRASNLRCKFGV